MSFAMPEGYDAWKLAAPPRFDDDDRESESDQEEDTTPEPTDLEDESDDV